MTIVGSQDEPDKLKIQEGDEIAIIDGSAELYWWKGQNQRSFEIGSFPRLASSVFFKLVKFTVWGFFKVFS